MNKTLTREAKSFHFQIKDFDDAQGIVRGYLSTFDNVDEGGDRVRPGAFKRTLQNKFAYKQKHSMKYLMPLLWQHDTNRPIGGYTDAKEDTIGLFVEIQLDLDVQQGQEAYSGLKKGYIFQQSMGYDCLQSEYVKDADGQMVRDLLEVRLWEGSVVTFPMNPEAMVTNVKHMHTKTITGNTSGPIGPRDESWDSGKAEKQIWDAAAKDDGTITASTAKKYFMVQDGDGSKKGDYSYPFWYVGDSPHICVGAVKAIAGAIQGSRGASAPDGLKGKVETLYSRINKKYSDDPQLTPPWSGDGKGKRSMQKKTLIEHYNEEMSEDLLEDWQDVYVCSLTAAIFDAFVIGDTVQTDISDALDAFKELVMGKFVVQAVECGLSQYLSDNDFSFNPSESTIHNGGDTYPMYGGYMSSRRRLARKAGRAISASNADKIQASADGLHDAADTAMAAMKEHTKAVHSAANDLATIIQGSEPAYGTDPGDAGDRQEGKSQATSHNRARGAQDRSSRKSDTGNEQEVDAALTTLRNLRAVR